MVVELIGAELIRGGVSFDLWIFVKMEKKVGFTVLSRAADLLMIWGGRCGVCEGG